MHTGIRYTLINVSFTVNTCIARHTYTTVEIRRTCWCRTGSAVLARIGYAFRNIIVTYNTRVPCITRTVKLIHKIRTAAMHTGVRHTLINIGFTVHTRVARHTNATVEIRAGGQPSFLKQPLFTT
jgi:hypothetical protein